MTDKQKSAVADTDAALSQEAEEHVHGPDCDHNHHHHGFQPYTRTQPKIGRNDPCSCNSGKKFKKCCGAK